jgi:hypothetical protein
VENDETSKGNAVKKCGLSARRVKNLSYGNLNRLSKIADFSTPPSYGNKQSRQPTKDSHLALGVDVRARVEQKLYNINIVAV